MVPQHRHQFQKGIAYFGPLCDIPFPPSHSPIPPIHPSPVDIDVLRNAWNDVPSDLRRKMVYCVGGKLYPCSQEALMGCAPPLSVRQWSPRGQVGRFIVTFCDFHHPCDIIANADGFKAARKQARSQKGICVLAEAVLSRERINARECPTSVVLGGFVPVSEGALLHEDELERQRGVARRIFVNTGQIAISLHKVAVIRRDSLNQE